MSSQDTKAVKAIRQAHTLQEKHPFRQWKTWPITGTQLTLTGYSRSNDKTFFHIPELKCGLDAALCEGRQPEHVFVTHTHNDHIADIEFLAGRSQGSHIYVPAQAKPFVERYIEARRELNHMAPFDPALAGDLSLHGVTPGEEIAFGKRAQYQVRVIECQHKIPCVGYAFSEKRTRLKASYQHIKDELDAAGEGKAFGQVMGKARKEGKEVNETYHKPLFAYMGDTHATVFEEADWLFDYPVIITECTFLDDAEQERADQNGHTTWRDLKPVVQGHPETTFVLIHFSLRHTDAEVVSFFNNEAQSAAEKNEPKLDNIVVWASEEQLLPEQHQSSK